MSALINPDDPSERVKLKKGSFFGEMGLIAGRRRTATIVANEDSFLVETPRRAMLRLINSVPGSKKVLDTAAIYRQIQTHLAPNIEKELLKDIVETATVESLSAGDELINKGDVIQNVEQIVRLKEGGYNGIFSFEPFSEKIHNLSDPVNEIINSIDYLNKTCSLN